MLPFFLVCSVGMFTANDGLFWIGNCDSLREGRVEEYVFGLTGNDFREEREITTGFRL